MRNTKKMSILSDGRYVPDGTYLYADIMPMIYIESFAEFINEYICKSQTLTEIAKNTNQRNCRWYFITRKCD